MEEGNKNGEEQEPIVLERSARLKLAKVTRVTGLTDDYLHEADIFG